MPLPEPWLRGRIASLHPVAEHLIYTFTQCREEVALHAHAIVDVWQAHPPLAPLGFHLGHIAGSVNRLTTYLTGQQLTPEQLARLKAESTPGPSLTQLMAVIDQEFAFTETVVRGIHPNTYSEPRYVGRQQLPTSVGGLIIHMAEHTQRHLGQAILIAKLARSSILTMNAPT